MCFSLASRHCNGFLRGIRASVVFRQEIGRKGRDFLVAETPGERVHYLMLTLAGTVGDHTPDENGRSQVPDRRDIVSTFTDVTGCTFRRQVLTVGHVAIDLENRGNLRRWSGVFPGFGRRLRRPTFLYQKCDQVGAILGRANTAKDHGRAGKIAPGVRDEPIQRHFGPDLTPGRSLFEYFGELVAVDHADPAPYDSVQVRPDPVDRALTDHVTRSARPVEDFTPPWVRLGERRAGKPTQSAGGSSDARHHGHVIPRRQTACRRSPPRCPRPTAGPGTPSGCRG